MLNIYRIEHKYAAYTSYVQTSMSRKEFSEITIALELAYFEAQGQSFADTLAPPDLRYLLVKHYGCQEVTRRRWMRTCARRRKEFDIYWNWERHVCPLDEQAVARLVPAGALVDLLSLREIMRSWYTSWNKETEKALEELDKLQEAEAIRAE